MKAYTVQNPKRKEYLDAATLDDFSVRDILCGGFTGTALGLLLLCPEEGLAEDDIISSWANDPVRIARSSPGPGWTDITTRVLEAASNVRYLAKPAATLRRP